ncbi:nicotinate-nucleotide adenylyltransferase [Pelagirhabdus alkalitolerans]|uniref:Probable nicotinate-nucleotide adenylyltransferase n=1 Tax=Pelagirhabdus alkalitolerans TaxID=1612202 RepID=A0A1G6HTE7_9BACI|nr:nicotinate-nucleotide adenylyltransferase [Pelagirhabdus alkalitolerans]SDB97569.1 nicotinate-nucleotide adenylyltransferase [Pelagirhabdus alkalitolerans]
MKKIGLLGGTFDPPHIGHLVIANEVYEKLSLDEIWFIPSAEPPHKKKATVSTDDRLAMIKSAIKDEDHFKVNDIEIKRQGKSYTIDTIKTLKDMHPDVSFYFIIGADMVEYLPKWYNINELIHLIRFVGVKRPEYRLETAYPVTLLDVPGLDISSTLIRERLLNNQSVRYLVPSGVIDVIRKRGLYE